MKRVLASVKGNDDLIAAANSLMVSAYKDEAKKKLVIVIVNFDKEEKKLKLDTAAVKPKSNGLNAYTTDLENNLKRSVMQTGNIVIKPRSIVTLETMYL